MAAPHPKGQKPTAAIGIICKTPKSGASKTRLLPLLGADGAASLAGCFLSDIVSCIDRIPADVGHKGYAVYAPEGSEATLRQFVPEHFGLVCRRDATLGVVLLGATEHLLAVGHDVVVLVNADSPTLPVEFLQQAIMAARQPGDRVVLGPATDGGYYLIALKTTHAHLFADIPWSTEGVLAATRVRAREIKLEAVVLPTWYDVDDAPSMRMLLDELAGQPLPFASMGATKDTAPGLALATRKFLAGQPDIVARLATSAPSQAMA